MLQTLLVPLSTWAAFVLHCSCWRWDAVQPTQRNPSYGAALQKGSSSCRQEVVVMGVIQSVMENVHIRTQRRKKKKERKKKPFFCLEGMGAALRYRRVLLLQPYEQRSLPVSAQRALGQKWGSAPCPSFLHAPQS